MMNELDPAMQMVEAEFEPERMLGDGPSRLASRLDIGLGMASVATADRASSDPELVESLSLQSEADFYLVNLACVLQEAEGETIEGATFTVMLDSISGVPVSAWSLLPAKLFAPATQIANSSQTEQQVTASAVISASFKFVQSHSESREQSEWWLSGVGEGTSKAGWRLRRVTGIDLNDDHRFKLIARVPKGHSVRVSCSLDARVSRGPLGTLVARARHKPNAQGDPYEFIIG